MPLSSCCGKPIVNVLASPLTGLTGVTVICGVMFNDQFSSIPRGRRTGVRELELSRRRGPTGLIGVLDVDRVAVQGREQTGGLIRPGEGSLVTASVIEVSAESSKTVFMKFAPLPPTPENKGM